MQRKNETLSSNIHQQQMTIDEALQTKHELEKRLFVDEQEISNFKRQIEEHIHQYQRLHNEYEVYKEDNQIQKSKNAKDFF